MEQMETVQQDAFQKLIKSRGRRNLKRHADLPQWKTFLKGVEKFRQDTLAGKRPKAVKTHNREYVITPQMVGVTFGVYNGKTFEQVNVVPEMMGHRLGEFSATRKRLNHGKAGIGATKSSTAITAR